MANEIEKKNVVTDTPDDISDVKESADPKEKKSKDKGAKDKSDKSKKASAKKPKIGIV